MVATKGAGPEPIPYESLDVDNLTSAIRFCLTSEAQNCAAVISNQMQQECGVDGAVESFHRHLPTKTLICGLLPAHVARWQYQIGRADDRRTINLSNEALSALLATGQLNRDRVRP